MFALQLRPFQICEVDHSQSWLEQRMSSFLIDWIDPMGTCARYFCHHPFYRPCGIHVIHPRPSLSPPQRPHSDLTTFADTVQVKGELDVFMSHDWPTHVPRYGNMRRLLSKKPYFKEEAETDTLGSPASWQLLQALKPRHWFAGHLHAAFAAVVPHGAAGVLPPGDKSAERVTKFLAMDKPMPHRRFVQVRCPVSYCCVHH